MFFNSTKRGISKLYSASSNPLSGGFRAQNGRNQSAWGSMKRAYTSSTNTNKNSNAFWAALGGSVIVGVFGLSTIFSDEKKHHQDKKPEHNPDDWIEATVCKVDDLKNGEMREVIVDGEKILLARVEDQYYAVSNKCPHAGAPLTQGVLSGDKLVCPWHNAEFSVKSGDLHAGPALNSLPAYPVKIETGGVVVSVPKDPKARLSKPKVCGHCNCKDKRTIVIVGSGGAGAIAAEALRQEGFKGKVIMVTKEQHLPYDRTMLSKMPGIAMEKILLRNEDFYKANGIDVHRGREVVELDADAKVIKFSDGSHLNFDSVLLATGAIPRHLPVPGGDLDNVLPLRTPEDADSIAAARTAQKVVVIGSSFIGMEVAAALKKNFKVPSVTVVGMEAVPFERVLGKDIGSMMQKFHEENGVNFRLHRGVKQLNGSGKVESVELDNGEVLEADVVIVGVGVIPNTKFLKGIPVNRDGSVNVDEHFKVRDGVYAAGDIATFPYDGEKARIEHWAVAQNQGRIAAHNMIKKDQLHYPFVPFFWTRQYDQSLKYAGFASSYDNVIVHGDLAARKFIAFYTKGEKVVAVASMGLANAVPAATELIRLKKMPTASELTKGPIDLAELLSKINA